MKRGFAIGARALVLVTFGALVAPLAMAADPPAAAPAPAGAAAPAAASGGDAAATEPAPPPKPALTHRPLRDNVPPTTAEPTEPRRFVGYPAAKEFSVVPRTDHFAFYPCSMCHKLLPSNTKPRKLAAPPPHPPDLVHGNGRLWCFDCHTSKDYDVLHSVGGAKIDFNESYLLCGQCHFNRQKDWYYGGHGKRVEGWQGERKLYSCTHCHDPHDPTIKPREPNKAPVVRAGLVPMQRTPHEPPAPWVRDAPTAAKEGQR